MAISTRQQLQGVDVVTEALVLAIVWELSHRKSDNGETVEPSQSVGHTSLAPYLFVDVFGESRPSNPEREALRTQVLEKKSALVAKGLLSIDGATVGLDPRAAERMSEAKANKDPYDRSDNLVAAIRVIALTCKPGPSLTLRKEPSSTLLSSSFNRNEAPENDHSTKDSPYRPPSRLLQSPSKRETLARTARPKFGSASSGESEEDDDEEIDDEDLGQQRSRVLLSPELFEAEGGGVGICKVGEDGRAEDPNMAGMLEIDGVRTEGVAIRREGRRRGRRGVDSEPEYESEDAPAAASGAGTGKGKKRKLGQRPVLLTTASPSSTHPNYPAPASTSVNSSYSRPSSSTSSSCKTRAPRPVQYGPSNPIIPFSQPPRRHKAATAFPSAASPSPPLDRTSDARRSRGHHTLRRPASEALGESAEAEEMEEEEEEAVEKEKTIFGETLAESRVTRKRGVRGNNEAGEDDASAGGSVLASKDGGGKIGRAQNGMRNASGSHGGFGRGEGNAGGEASMNWTDSREQEEQEPSPPASSVDLSRMGTTHPPSLHHFRIDSFTAPSLVAPGDGASTSASSAHPGLSEAKTYCGGAGVGGSRSGVQTVDERKGKERQVGVVETAEPPYLEPLYLAVKSEDEEDTESLLPPPSPSTAFSGNALHHPSLPRNASSAAIAAASSHSSVSVDELALFLSTLDSARSTDYRRSASTLVKYGVGDVATMTLDQLGLIVSHVDDESERFTKKKLTSAEMWDLKQLVRALEKRRREEDERETWGGHC